MRVGKGRRRLAAGFGLGLVLALGGCLPARSLHPPFSHEEAIVLPEAVGTWIVEGKEADAERLVIRRSQTAQDDAVYELIHSEGKNELVLEARFVRIEDEVFMDAFHRETGDVFLLPVHLVARVRLDQEVLEIGWLRGEWVEDRLEEGSLSIGHVEVDGDVVLTAPTEDIQALLAHVAKEDDAFDATRHSRPAAQ